MKQPIPIKEDIYLERDNKEKYKSACDCIHDFPLLGECMLKQLVEWHNHIISAHYLGRVYESGIMVEKSDLSIYPNKDLAIYYYRLASEAGYQHSTKKLFYILEDNEREEFVRYHASNKHQYALKILIKEYDNDDPIKCLEYFRDLEYDNNDNIELLFNYAKKLVKNNKYALALEYFKLKLGRYKFVNEILSMYFDKVIDVDRETLTDYIIILYNLLDKVLGSARKIISLNIAKLINEDISMKKGENGMYYLSNSKNNVSKEKALMYYCTHYVSLESIQLLSDIIQNTVPGYIPIEFEYYKIQIAELYMNGIYVEENRDIAKHYLEEGIANINIDGEVPEYVLNIIIQGAESGIIEAKEILMYIGDEETKVKYILELKNINFYALTQSLLIEDINDEDEYLNIVSKNIKFNNFSDKDVLNIIHRVISKKKYDLALDIMVLAYYECKYRCIEILDLNLDLYLGEHTSRLINPATMFSSLIRRDQYINAVSFYQRVPEFEKNKIAEEIEYSRSIKNINDAIIYYLSINIRNNTDIDATVELLNNYGNSIDDTFELPNENLLMRIGIMYFNGDICTTNINYARKFFALDMQKKNIKSIDDYNDHDDMSEYDFSPKNPEFWIKRCDELIKESEEQERLYRRKGVERWCDSCERYH
jgi:hypothetical protein